MSLFDLAAGLVLLVSAFVGWLRGGAREVAAVAAFLIAGVIALIALPLAGPIARRAIHTTWLANIAALVIVFAAAYALLRAVAAAMAQRLHRSPALGGVDRTVGAGFGLIRALVVLGMANLTINAVTPPERLPAWISHAALYPLSGVSAVALKAFAPNGAMLARRVAPMVGHAIAGGGGQSDAENRAYYEGAPPASGTREETKP